MLPPDIQPLSEDPTDVIVRSILLGIDNGPPKEVEKVAPIAAESIHDTITAGAASLLKSALGAISQLELNMAGATDPEMVEAYAGVIKSGTGALEVLAKLQLQQDKRTAALELESKKHEHRKLEIDHRVEKNESGTTNNVLILATREEVLDRMLAQQSTNDLQNEFVELEAEVVS